MDESQRDQIENALQELYYVLDILYNDDGDANEIAEVESAIYALEDVLADVDWNDEEPDLGYDALPLSDDLLSSMRGQVFLSPDEAAEYLRDIPTGGVLVYWFENGVVYWTVAVYTSNGEFE